MDETSLFDPAVLVWVDESGFNWRNTIRAYRYSLRAVDHQLKFIRGVCNNSIGTMSYLGVEDVYLVEDSDTFEDFCTKCLIPILMPFNGITTHSVVMMDNCFIHHMLTELQKWYIALVHSSTLRHHTAQTLTRLSWCFQRSNFLLKPMMWYFNPHFHLTLLLLWHSYLRRLLTALWIYILKLKPKMYMYMHR